jgi:hypothetical protein
MTSVILLCSSAWAKDAAEKILACGKGFRPLKGYLGGRKTQNALRAEASDFVADVAVADNIPFVVPVEDSVRVNPSRF